MRRLAAFGTAASAGFLVAALLGSCGAPAGPGPTSPSMPTVPPLTSAPDCDGRRRKPAVPAGSCRGVRRPTLTSRRFQLPVEAC